MPTVQRGNGKRKAMWLLLVVILAAYPIWRLAVKIQQHTRNSRLLQAIYLNDVAAVQALLAQGADPNTSISRENVSLPDLLRAILPGNRSDPGTQPILFSALDNSTNNPDATFAMLKAMLDHGGNPNLKDTKGECLLMRAMYNTYNPIPPYQPRDLGRLALLLIDRGADVNAVDKVGGTALMWAAETSTPDVVQRLLTKGAKVDARDHEGATALMCAAFQGNPTYAQAIAGMLLDAGADVNAKSNDGNAVLIWMLTGQRSLVPVLISRGADVHARLANDRSLHGHGAGAAKLSLSAIPPGATLLDMASAARDPILVTLLKAKGVKPMP